MKIGELAKRTGVAASRIRFYETSGLIQAVNRKANGYREYPPEALLILEIIIRAQNAGFSLDEIRHMLPISPNDSWQHENLLDGIKKKVHEIDALQQRLEQNKAQLLGVVQMIEMGMEGIPCADRPTWMLNNLREQGLLTMLNMLPVKMGGSE